MYQGRNVRVDAIEEGFVELCFDRTGAPANLFDADTVAELKEAVAAIAATPDVRGVLATSAKDGFIIGADVTEFVEKFKLPHADLVEDVRLFNEAFVALEDLALPTVVALDGDALGGGFQFVLACALRVMSRRARVGLPEVRLGLFPGLGGTVRLPRVTGARTAAQWVADGQPRGAEAALAVGAADAVCDSDSLRGTALALLRRAAGGGIDWREAQQRKRRPLNGEGGAAVHGHASAPALEDFVAWRASMAAAGLHQPAALAAVDLMERAAPLDRDAALALESEAFARIARTQASAALVQTFLNEQTVRKIAGHRAQGALPVKRAAVLGAGIVGGGIALTSARAGIPVRLGDLSPQALQTARAAIDRQLTRHVEARCLSNAAAQTVQRAITTQTGHAGFGEADILIEAIVERLDVKRRVLAELEGRLREDAVLASTTSGLRIDDIAGALKRPERFVGLHFFAPVPAVPLVEVVQGSASSERAVATAVAYAQAMNKIPVVVKDGPGFLVNRLLMACTGATRRLIADGGDHPAIDRAMRAFGWPIGPSYLRDVLGIDTGGHVVEMIAAGGLRGFTDEEIVDRLMMPFIVEAAHALAEGVVATPAELDMALQLALGCPAHIGGALEYADWLGLDEVVRRCDALRAHGPMYDPTPRMRQMAAAGGTFYEQASFTARGS
ncbi:MAG TPA: 3-hydroxyacyl-CoA dehydrogenase NAD-binding domain-containing protein [Burkholderiaceae bacterium]|nr:3-hydroxyacyl-CoA dehydrogenase NAD-binding domain-containing protein [Burkholderiaceae bacterium]